MSVLDDEERGLLLDVLAAAKVTRDASLRAAAASEQALAELRTLNEIVAREVSPLGPFRADLIRRLEEHFNRVGELALELGELRTWRDDHEVGHAKSANGGG